jgi:hypothetical protein
LSDTTNWLRDREAAITKTIVFLSRRKRGPRGFQYTPDEIVRLAAILRERGEVWESGYDYEHEKAGDAMFGFMLRTMP